MTSYESTGKSLDEAIRAGLTAMGVERDAVSVEVLEKPKSGFFGLGSTLARVKLTLVETDNLFAKPVSAPRPATPTRGPSAKPTPTSARLVNSPVSHTAPVTTAKFADAKPADTKPVDTKPVSSARPASQPTTNTASIPRVPVSRPAPMAKPQFPRNEKPYAAQKSRTSTGSAVPAAPRQPKPSRPSHAATPEQEKTAVEFISGLMAQMKNGVTASVKTDAEGVILINLEGENLGNLIGRRGDTLDAIQHLVSHVVNQNPDKLCRIHVDAADYRTKRQEALERLAHRMSDNAIKYRNNIVLEPMNAYERHIIHLALQDVSGVSTYSTGTDPQRRVVIAVQRSGAQGGSRSGGRPGARGSRPDSRNHSPRPASRPEGSRPAPVAVSAAPSAAPVPVTAPAPAVVSAPMAVAPVPQSTPTPRGLPVKEFGGKRSKFGE